MYMWQVCLGIIICTLPIGILLRWYAEQRFYMLPNRNWIRGGRANLAYIRTQNIFLYCVFVLEGAIGNTAFIGLLVSIPVYFIFGV